MKKLFPKFLAGAVIAGLSLTASAEQLDHFIINGQSLSTGHQSWPVVSTENVPGNFMLGNQIWNNYGHDWEAAMHPLIGTVAKQFQNDGGNGTKDGGAIAECPLLGAVNHLQLKYGTHKILASSVGVSGAAVEELSKECETRTYYKDFQRTLTNAKTAVAGTDYQLNCPAIFWMQGEFNYTVKGDPCGLKPGEYNTTDKRTYRNLMVKLKENMQHDIMEAYGQTKAPVWITYQTGAQYVRDELGIGMAQLEAANTHDDIIMAGPVYPMTDRGGHLDANGYRWFGEMLAKVYYKTQVLGEKFLGLQPMKITREDGGKTIRVKFTVPEGALVFDTKTLPKVKNYGFNVYHNGYGNAGKQNIKTITIDGDDVVMTFDNALTGKVFVTYGDPTAYIDTPVSGKNDLKGHGNLRDSDPYEGVLEYIDLDKKDAGGNYVYMHKEGHTLRPDFEPMDEDGNVIYGKKYPLYNFAVSFYYQLREGVDELVILDENGNAVPDPNEPVEGTLMTAYVNGDTGADTNDGTSADKAFATLNAAIKAIKWDGATIIVNGTTKLDEDLNLDGLYNLTIKGENNAVIDGQNKARLGEGKVLDVTLENLTIQNCFAYMGGSVIKLTQGDLNVTNCIFKNNRTSCFFEADGTLFLNNGDMNITDCEFTGNYAYSGGAIKHIQGTTNIKNTLFDGNRAEAAATESQKGDARGGVLYVSNAVTTLDNCTVVNNYSSNSGGAFYIKYSHQSNKSFTVKDCDILFNRAGEHSGVLMSWNTVDPNFTYTFVNTTIYGNTAHNVGGVLWFLEGLNTTQKMDFYNCTIVGNHSESGVWHCGGIHTFSPNLNLRFVNTILEGNTGGNNYEYSDLHIKGYATDKVSYTRSYYSIIGKFIAQNNCTLTEFGGADRYSYVNVSPAKKADGEANYAGLDALVDNKYLPFKSKEEAVKLKGNDKKLARDLDITTDRLGNERKNNVMGAVEVFSNQSGIYDAIVGGRKLDIRVDGDNFVIALPNAADKADVRVFTTAGQQVLATTVSADATATVDASALGRGVYAVEVAGQGAALVFKR